MSARKILTLALIGLGSVVAIITLWMLVPTLAHAQCGDIESSCSKCHQAVHPVCGTTDWHSEFGHRYACWNCHGGNDVAPDKEQAHVGLVSNPLEDAFTSCYACHPNDYQLRAEQLAKQIGVPVSYHEPTPTPSPTPAPVATQPIVLPPVISPPVAATHSTTWLQTLWLVPMLAGVLLAWVVWRRRVA